MTFNDCPDLAALPWETLTHGAVPHPSAFFGVRDVSRSGGDHGWSLVRYEPGQFAPAPNPPQRLRVLVLAGVGPYPTTGTRTEVGIATLRRADAATPSIPWPVDVHFAGTEVALRGVLGDARLARLRQSDAVSVTVLDSQNSLEAVLAPRDTSAAFQVLHWIGHTVVTAATHGPVAGALDLGEKMRVTFEQLTAWLSRRPLRLLTIAGCALDHTGAATLLRAAEQVVGFHGLAPGFEGDEWCGEFYGALRGEKRIDEAAAHSRGLFDARHCPWIVGHWSRAIEAAPFFSPDEIELDALLDDLRQLALYQTETLKREPLFGMARDLYVPLALRRPSPQHLLRTGFWRPNRREQDPYEPVDVDTLPDVSRPCLVESEAGYGKSTLLRHLAWQELRKPDRSQVRLPIFVPLASFHTSQSKSFADWLARKVIEDKALVQKRYMRASQQELEELVHRRIELLERLAKAGRALFLLDGLDEQVHVAGGELAATRRTAAPIRDIVGNCPIVAASRRGHSKALPLPANSRGADLTATELFVVDIAPSVSPEERRDDAGRLLAPGRRQFLVLYLGNDRQKIDTLLDMLAQIDRQEIDRVANNAFVLSLCAYVAWQRGDIGRRLHQLYSAALEAMASEGARVAHEGLLERRAQVDLPIRRDPIENSIGALESLPWTEVAEHLAWWFFDGRFDHQRTAPALERNRDTALGRDLRKAVEGVLLGYVAERHLVRVNGELRAPQLLVEHAIERLARMRLLSARGADYEFVHRSMMEFLVARRLMRADMEPVLDDILAWRVWTESWEIVLRFYVELADDLAAKHGATPTANRRVTSALADMELKIPAGHELAAGRLARIGDLLGHLGDPRLVESRRWVPIAPGAFFWGAQLGKCHASNHPNSLHRSLPPKNPDYTVPYAYEIARWPVTVGEWREFAREFGKLVATARQQLLDAWVERMQAEEARGVYSTRVLDIAATDELAKSEVQLGLPPGAPNHPMTNISFWDSCWYCAWMTSRCHGYLVRPPSDREWEKASRSGQKLGNERWPWGDDYAEGHANTRESKLGRTSSVGVFVRGHAGCGSNHTIFDMCGNVEEPCAERAEFFELEWTRLSDDGCFRVMRGGDWTYRLSDAGCAARSAHDPTHRGRGVGFRPVRVFSV